MHIKLINDRQIYTLNDICYTYIQGEGMFMNF